MSVYCGTYEMFVLILHIKNLVQLHIDSKKIKVFENLIKTKNLKNAELHAVCITTWTSFKYVKQMYIITIFRSIAFSCNDVCDPLY